MKPILLAVIVSVLFTSCSRHSSDVILEPGDYLLDKYIQDVRDTRSPLLAGKSGGRLLYQVRSDGATVSLSATYNFHEGGESFRLLSNGSLQLVEPSNEERPPVIT